MNYEGLAVLENLKTFLKLLLLLLIVEVLLFGQD